MREETAFYWTYIDPITRRRCRTRYMCTEEHASSRAAAGDWINPEPIGPARVTMIPETDAERARIYRENSTSAFMNGHNR